MSKQKILLLGPAGSGKGTQAEKLSEELNLKHISTGDLIRSEIKSGSELGNKVKAIVEAGQLVSDDIVNEIVKANVAGQEGFILDGYPRTLEQAKFFDSYSKFDKVFNFQVQKEELLKRLTGRRMCSKEKDPNCKGTFHIVYKAPKEDGICDLCGSPLIQRKDDQPEVIEKRLSTYDAETGVPLVDYYSKQSILVDMDANKAPDQVYKEVLTELNHAIAS